MSKHQYVDDAPFGAPPGVTLHYVLTVSTTAETLIEVTDATTSAAHIVPSFLEGEGEDTRRWPRALYIGHADTLADVWVTWDGNDPVVGTTAPIGVKVPPTYPALRIPMPAAIQAGTIKLLSDSVAGTPVIVTYEF